MIFLVVPCGDWNEKLKNKNSPGFYEKVDRQNNSLEIYCEETLLRREKTA